MSNIVRFDKLRSIGNASLTASYSPIGFNATPSTPAPFTHAMRVLHFINDTDGDVLVSFDGTNDNMIVLADSFTLYDLTSDQDSNEKFRYENGTQIYVKYSTVPTTGTFYLVAIYGKGE